MRYANIMVAMCLANTMDETFFRNADLVDKSLVCGIACHAKYGDLSFCGLD